MEVYTIGHSTRPLSEFVSLLEKYAIETLIDIRHFPKSRHNPQFNKESLEEKLPQAGIEYVWLEELGGYREGGYAKYVCTKDFRAGLEQLKKVAAKSCTAFMCAELLWWRCHRRYVSDELKRQKWKVWHIFDESRVEPHLIGKRRKIKCN